jgi:hypothetical protein
LLIVSLERGSYNEEEHSFGAHNTIIADKRDTIKNRAVNSGLIEAKLEAKKHATHTDIHIRIHRSHLRI